MALWLIAVVFDALNPTVLADFWAGALGYVTRRSGQDFAWIVDPSDTRTGLFFQQVSEPKSRKNRVHIDLNADDLDAEVARLTSLGATKVRAYHERGGGWVIMQDPEGNEFCVMPGS